MRDWLSGSELDEALRDTEAPSATDWSEPALAVGASLSAETVMTTVSVSAVVPSVTETWKVVVYPEVACAAVNVGAAALVLERVCAVPLDTLHVYVRDSDSGSELPAALRVTEAPSATDWSEPALAVGASLSAVTVITTVSAVPAALFAVQVMDRVVVYPEVASTAVKVGPAAVEELRV